MGSNAVIGWPSMGVRERAARYLFADSGPMLRTMRFSKNP